MCRWKTLSFGWSLLQRRWKTRCAPHAQMAMALDYHVTVCDPRDEYAEEWDLPGATLLRG